MEFKQEYGKGFFLVANPVLPDPNFSRSVVLLCDHNEQGSFGLVINRSAEINISEVFSDHDILRSLQSKVFVGGPVAQSQVFYLCRSDTPLPGTELICDNLHLGLNWDELEDVLRTLKNPQENIRFYMGYSGWGAGQLANEMSQRSWLTCAAKNFFVFGDSEESIWTNVIRSLGKDYEYLLHAPLNPQWN
jgi:putative transcriptional regulator